MWIINFLMLPQWFLFMKAMKVLSWLYANILCLRLFEVEFSAKVHGNAYINRKMFEIRKESLQNCTLTCIFLWNKYKPIFSKYRKQSQKRSSYIRTLLYRCDGQYQGWWINEGQTRSIEMLRIDMSLQFTYLFLTGR